MNDPQVWTLIGVFAAMMLGGMTLMTTMMSRVIRAEAGGLRSELNRLRGEMNARFDTVDHKIETLDKKVAVLATRFWGSP